MIIDLITTQINPSAALASVAFATNNDMIYGFGDNQANRTGILQALQDERNDYNFGPSTRTFNAMRYAIDEFASNNIPPTDNNLIYIFNYLQMVSQNQVWINEYVTQDSDHLNKDF